LTKKSSPKFDKKIFPFQGNLEPQKKGKNELDEDVVLDAKDRKGHETSDEDEQKNEQKNAKKQEMLHSKAKVSKNAQGEIDQMSKVSN
jgi:hypothetical protein